MVHSALSRLWPFRCNSRLCGLYFGNTLGLIHQQWGIHAVLFFVYLTAFCAHSVSAVLPFTIHSYFSSSQCFRTLIWCCVRALFGSVVRGPSLHPHCKFFLWEPDWVIISLLTVLYSSYCPILTWSVYITCENYCDLFAHTQPAAEKMNDSQIEYYHWPVP